MLSKITIRLPEPVTDDLHRYAAENKLSVSAAACKLIEQGLNASAIERRKTNVLFSIMLMIEAVAEKNGIEVEPLYSEAKQIVGEELYGEQAQEEGEAE